MKSTSEDKNSKQKILDAAMEIFAGKGFDGARVDEIAKTAGVNKALLYYYFESKEAILKELIEINAKDFLEQKEKLFSDLGLTQGKFIFGKVDDLIESGFELLSTKKEILKIMLSEALKSGTNDTALFDFFQLLAEDTVQRAKGLGFKSIDTQYLKTITIFMGMMPICLFIVLGDKWSEYSGYNAKVTKTMFLDIYKRLYLKMVSDLSGGKWKMIFKKFFTPLK